MYKSIQTSQITFQDFNQSCGMELSPQNQWCRLGNSINWAAAEELYLQNFPGKTDRPRIPCAWRWVC